MRTMAADQSRGPERPATTANHSSKSRPQVCDGSGGYLLITHKFCPARPSSATRLCFYMGAEEPMEQLDD
ncbi:hypothetical protein P3T25_000052 [Paraburkholderia sp. GAS32]